MSGRDDRGRPEDAGPPEQHPAAERIRERVSQREREELLDFENVISVGIGFGERGGRRTKSVEITVRVTEKLPEDDLPDSEVIPEEINGVQTDVIETDPETEEIVGERGEQIRPLTSGVSAGGDGNGTANFFIRSSDGQPIAVTNRHVACSSDEDCTGQPFYQPEESSISDGTAEQVGTITQLGTWHATDSYDNVDVAVAEIDAGFDMLGENFGAGDLGAWEDPVLGERYVNNGSRTGYISGECIELDVTVTVNHSGVTDDVTYQNCCRFDRYDTVQSDWDGNSGSLHGRVDDDGVFHPVALHFAGTDSHSTAMPMWRIVEEIGEVDPPEPGNQQTFDEEIGARHEVGVTRARPRGDSFEVVVLVSNTAGNTDTSGSVTLKNEDNTSFWSAGFDLDSMEWEIITFDVGAEYNDQDFSAETDADLQTFELFAEGMEPLNVTQDVVNAEIADGGTVQSVVAIYKKEPDDPSEEQVWSTGPIYGTTVSRPDDNDFSTGHEGWNGIAIEPNTELAGVRVQVSNDTTELERVGIQAHQQGGTDWIHRESFGKLGPGDEVDVIISNESDYLQAGTRYDILMDNGGDSYGRGWYNDVDQFPHSSSDFDVFAGMYSDGASSSENYYNIGDVTAITDSGPQEPGPNTGSTVDRPADNDYSTGVNNWSGVTVVPDEELSGFRLMVSEETHDLDRVGIQTHQQGGTDWIHLESFGTLGPGDVIDVTIPNEADYLQAGTEYDVLMDNNGDNYQRGVYNDSNQFPYSSTHFDVSGGMYTAGASTSSNFYNMTELTAILPEGMDMGTAISVPDPNNADSSSNLNGLYLDVKDTPLVGVRCTLAPSGTNEPSGYTHAECVDGNGNSISERKDISLLEPGETFDIMFDSSRTADFGVGLDAGGNSYTRSRYEETGQYPYTGDEMDIVYGMYSSAPQTTSDVAYNFSEVQPILE